VDGTLLVVDVGSTRRAFLARSLETLQAANGRLLGVVLNRITPTRSAYYSFAYQYADYYSGEGQRKKRSQRLPWLRWPWQPALEQRALRSPAEADTKPRATD
jgi:Mrp family chromosome partitioning ATPase